MIDPELEARIRDLVYATRSLMELGVEMPEIRRTMMGLVAGLGLGTEYAEGQRIIEMVFDSLES